MDKENSFLLDLLDRCENEIYVFDAQTLYICYSNRRAQINLGHDPVQLLGLSVLDILQDFQEDSLRTLLAPVAQGNSASVRFQTRHRRSDGTVYQAETCVQITNRGDSKVFLATVVDVTDRKTSEDALRRSEERLRLIADALPTLVSYVDASGFYRFNNKAYEEWFQHPREEVTGRHMKEILGEDAWNVIKPKIDAALSGQLIVYEAEVNYKGRGKRWIEATYVPHFDGTEAVGLFVLVNDITLRKASEQALRQSETQERLRADELETVMAAVPAVVWIAHDPACQVITGNQASYDLLRIPPKANQSATASEEADRPAHFKVMKDGIEIPTCDLPVQLAAAGKEVRDFEEEIIFDDGTHIYLYGHAIPLRNEVGEVRGSVAAFVDITDRKIAEEEVRQSEALFRSMADNAPAILWVTDSTGYCTYLSSMWYEFTGREPGKDIGFGWLDALHPSDVPQAKQKFLQANNDQTSFSMDYRLRRRDGIYRWAIDTGLPRFEGEVFQGFVGCVFDVHERKMAEEANARLIETLRQADQRKDEFLATLAHELRNPLAPIRNGLQIMRLASDDHESHNQIRNMMERQLEQLVHLVDDLLDLSRISRDKIELRTERIDLEKTIRHAVETSRPLIEQAGHRLTISMPPDPIYVDADATRLAQVFTNLLNNAAKYTENSGQIFLSLRREGTDAKVSVKDNGTGIPQELLSQVFEMFTQIDRNLERCQGGLGIGLSIVKRLVEMHGGTVEATSDGLGLGSEFLVSLPIVDGKVNQQLHDHTTLPSVQRRVLVVDDNKDAAKSLAIMMRLVGNEVQTAFDGFEALKVAASFSPEIIILDIGMPRMNGYETVKEIRKQLWGKNVTVVALTGWGQDEDRRKSAEAGFDYHLVKPVDLTAINELLETFSR